MRFKTALLAILFISFQASAQQWISGKITDDKGTIVAGVVVSDGYKVIKTDAKGEYFFETNPKAKFVFMSTPNGYEQKGNYYMKLGESGKYDFSLKKGGNTSNRFVHMADTEANIHKDWVDLLKQFVANTKPAFVIFNGDICYEKGLRFHARELTSEQLGVRAVYSLGNHDLVAGAYGEELYEDLFGPVWYSFNVGGVHFVNIPVLYGDKVPRYTTDEIFNWMRADLESIPSGTPVVLIDHHLIGFSDNFVLKTAKQELDLLAYNLKGYLYGHYHTNVYHKTLKGGVATISTMSPNKGGIDHSPSSFRVIEFNSKGDLKSHLKYSPINRHVVATGFMEKPESGISKNNNKSYISSFRNSNKNIGFTVIANIYDTPTEVEKAAVIVGAKEYSLKQKSSWSWNAVLPNNVGEKAVENGAKIMVKFSDGSVVVNNVEINDGRPENIMGGGTERAAQLPAGTSAAGSLASGQPEILWATNMGGTAFMTSPLIAGDLVISSTTDEDSASVAAIHAIDIASGEIRWSFKTRNSIKNNMALWEGVVVGCDVEGNVYALDAASGKLKWSKELRQNSIHPVYTEGVTVNDGIVYAGQGNFLTAMRVSDGKTMWVNEAWKGGVSTIASPVVDEKSGVLLSAAYWTGRFAQDAATGKLLWEKKDDDSRISDNSPVVFDGHFFYASPGYITEVNPLTGEELLKLKINYTINSNSRPLVTEKYYVTGTADKGVVAYDRSAGYKEIWNFKTNPAIFYTAPYTKDFQMTVESGVALNGNDLFFGANDGFLYCVDVRNGTFRWRLNLGAPILCNIVIDAGILYVTDFGGNMWAIKI